MAKNILNKIQVYNNSSLDTDVILGDVSIKILPYQLTGDIEVTNKVLNLLKNNPVLKIYNA